MEREADQQRGGERALDHGFDEIWRKGVGWFVLTGTRKRGWEVLQGAAATVQAVKSVKSLEAGRKAYREGRIEFRTEEPPEGPRARSFGEIWESGMGFMVRTQRGGRGWLKGLPPRIPMRLLKGAHSKVRVHRAYTANKVVLEAEGEEPMEA